MGCSIVEPEVSIFDCPRRAEKAHVDRPHTHHHLRHILGWRIQRPLWRLRIRLWSRRHRRHRRHPDRSGHSCADRSALARLKRVAKRTPSDIRCAREARQGSRRRRRREFELGAVRRSSSSPRSRRERRRSRSAAFPFADRQTDQVDEVLFALTGKRGQPSSSSSATSR